MGILFKFNIDKRTMLRLHVVAFVCLFSVCEGFTSHSKCLISSGGVNVTGEGL